MSAPFQNQPGPQQTNRPPTPPAPKPYEPTPEEQALMAQIGAAIAAGAGCAASAEAASNDSAFLNYSNGVKALTQAYEEIRTGGKASSGHQGS